MNNSKKVLQGQRQINFSVACFYQPATEFSVAELNFFYILSDGYIGHKIKRYDFFYVAIDDLSPFCCHVHSKNRSGSSLNRRIEKAVRVSEREGDCESDR